MSQWLHTWTYLHWLLALSLAFIVLERLRPRPGHTLVRPWILTDVFYVVFNGHFLSGVLALGAVPLAALTERALTAAGLHRIAHYEALSPYGFWTQLVVAFVVLDLIQWCIHNALHRVPWLWELHKVHHSIVDMDWLGSLRFHWAEIVVYKTLQYVPLAMLGARGDVLFVIAVVGTAIGHFNHANLAVSIGPLKYVMNSPEMHIWHHTHPSAGPINRNFGINLSLWDWLFGTAFLPEDSAAPLRLGFVGVERFPRTPFGQWLWPLRAPARLKLE